MLPLSFTLLLSLTSTPDESALLKAVVSGRKCTTARFDDSQLNCRFKVDTAEFEIAGVSVTDSQFAVYSANVSSTWVAFGLGHQCAMVKNAKAVVFVSPKNAKVYTSWHLCSVASSDGA